MNERFQIDDLISQGPDGVFFRATDGETGQKVVLRRYFPFGRGGGGLDAEAGKAFKDSIDGFSSIKSEALCRIVGGGCDDVDGIPFIATEWIDGETIEFLKARSMLGVTDIVLILTSVMNLSLWLSQSFGREALWIDLDLAAMWRKNSEKPHDYVFCVSIPHWLGLSNKSDEMSELAGLASQLVLGVPQTAGNPKHAALLRWIEWLRAEPKSTPLKKARDKLVTELQSIRSAPMRKSPLPRVIDGSRIRQKAGSPVSAISLFCIFLGIGTIGLATYAYQTKWHRSVAKKSSVASKNTKGNLKKKMSKKPSSGNVAAAVNPTKGSVISSGSHLRLAENINRKVVIEGNAERVDWSKSGKTYYLVFLEGEKSKPSRVGIRLSERSPDQMKSDLQSFVGKKIRASGEVKKEMQGNLSSMAVMINDVSAIQIID